MSNDNLEAESKVPARLVLEICCPKCGEIAKTEDLKPGKSLPTEMRCEGWCEEMLVVPAVWVKG